MRRLPVVAAAGVGLVLALFGGAAACGCRSETARPAPGTYSRPPQPDADELKIIRFGQFQGSFETQGSRPSKLPEPPPLPAGTRAEFVEFSTPDGVGIGQLVGPPSLVLDIRVRAPEGASPSALGLAWPWPGLRTPPTPEELPPPVSVRVLEGDANVTMVPLTGETASYGVNKNFWIMENRARAHISWGPTRDGARHAPGFPARLVLAPVVNVDGQEVMGQPIEITIRPLSQGN